MVRSTGENHRSWTQLHLLRSEPVTVDKQLCIYSFSAFWIKLNQEAKKKEIQKQNPVQLVIYEGVEQAAALLPVSLTWSCSCRSASPADVSGAAETDGLCWEPRPGRFAIVRSPSTGSTPSSASLPVAKGRQAINNKLRSENAVNN